MITDTLLMKKVEELMLQKAEIIDVFVKMFIVTECDPKYIKGSRFELITEQQIEGGQIIQRYRCALITPESLSAEFYTTQELIAELKKRGLDIHPLDIQFTSLPTKD